MPTTRACMHLVTRGHFRSCDKDGGYTIQYAVPENTMLRANIAALSLIEWELLPIEVLHCGNRNFLPFWLLWPWPWPNDLHIWTQPEDRGDTPHMQIWTSYVKPFESYHLTDTHTDRTKSITLAASRVVNMVWLDTHRCDDWMENDWWSALWSTRP